MRSIKWGLLARSLVWAYAWTQLIVAWQVDGVALVGMFCWPLIEDNLLDWWRERRLQRLERNLPERAAESFDVTSKEDDVFCDEFDRLRKDGMCSAHAIRYAAVKAGYKAI